MDRTSKLLIVGWSVAALLAEVYYVRGAWRAAGLLGPGAFAVAAIGTMIDRRTVAPILACAYLTPILVFLANGSYHAHFSVVWLAGVLGVIVPDALRTGWHLPARWRVPLACWVGGVCLTAPIVIFRNVDFRWELLFRGRQTTEALGGMPVLTNTQVLHVALVLSIGLLWFDWLCAQDEPFFHRWVAAPLAMSSLALGAVACYQMFVDVHFMNASVFGGMDRAVGTMLDGNVAGAIAACWIGGWSIRALGTSGWRRAVPLAAMVLMGLSVWATGSRTAFAWALVIASVGWFGVIRGRVNTRIAAASVLGGVVLVLAAVVLLSRLDARTVGPFRRMEQVLPSPSVASARTFARTMWDRDGYGAAATTAIREYPWFGIGVGSFYEMASEFGLPLPPDNAQNWYRHQLAELGMVGSVGWVLFVLSFGWWVMRPHAGEQAAAWPARGVLIGVACVSLLGMPGQDAAVALTLSTFAAWYLLQAGVPIDRVAPGRSAWISAGAVVVVFAMGSAHLAAGRLRLPGRIQRLGGDYVYGFYWPEPDGEGGEYRWARKQATAVVPATTRSLELTLRVNHGDLAQHPAHVKAWVDGRRVIDGELTPGADSITTTVLLPMNQPRVLIDTVADRAIVAPPPDGRELALMVRWRFLPSSR